MNHNTKSTQWNPPPPISALPDTPPNNLTSSLTPNILQSNFNFPPPETNINKTLPQSPPKSYRNHLRASTVDSTSLTNQWNIHEVKSMTLEIAENEEPLLAPIKDGQPSIAKYSPMSTTKTHQSSILSNVSSDTTPPPSHRQNTSTNINTNPHRHTHKSMMQNPAAASLATLSKSTPPSPAIKHYRHVYHPPKTSLPPLKRKKSKPYSNTTDQIFEFQKRGKSLKPVPPPRDIKKPPLRDIPAKPPIYTKKNMASTSIPPPPPRSIPDTPPQGHLLPPDNANAPSAVSLPSSYQASARLVDIVCRKLFECMYMLSCSCSCSYSCTN